MAKWYPKFNMTFSHLLFVGVSIVALLFVVVLLWWDIARQPLAPGNFSYSADTLTSQVFYNPASGQATSPRYLKTNLELSLEYEGETPTVRSTLGTTTVHGRTSLTHSRQPVDPQHGVYLKDGSPTDEFILAPRGLARGESFSYRHPAYSISSRMEYEGEETINGLQVYRYIARFAEEPIYLGKVINPDSPIPETARLAYEPQLKVWIEPTSGWMVKYYNEVSAHLVDKVSGVDAGPYEKITETMSEESVMQHLAYATTQKLKFTFVRQIVPSLILTTLFILLTIGFIATVKARTVPIYAATGTVLTISSAIVVGWMMDIELLKVFFTGPTGINPLTALCFVLVALAVVALYRNRRRASALAAGIVGLFALLQILSELSVVSFSVDQILFSRAIQESDLLEAHMSIYTAATFLLLAVGLVKASFTSRKSKLHFARFLVGMVFTIGMLGLVLKLARFDKLLTISFVDPFSAIPSLLFVVCSFALLQLFRTLNERPDNVLSTLRAVRWPAFATLPLVIIGVWTQLERNSVTNDLSVNFTSQIATFEKAVNAQMSTYGSTLDGVRALFGASVDVTAAEFHQYVGGYLSKQQPGLDEIGFASLVKDSDVRTPIAYLETFRSSTHRYTGYDLSSDAVLKDAMEYARDTGKAIMSKRAASLQSAEQVNPRVFIFHPIYKNNTDITTTAQRRQALTGYVFAVMDTTRLFSTIAPKALDTIDVAVYDGVGIRDESLLYAKHMSRAYTPKIQETRTLFTTNRPWTFIYTAQPGFGEDSIKRTLPSLIFFGGSSVYFAALLILYFILRQGVVLRRKEFKKERNSDF